MRGKGAARGQKGCVVCGMEGHGVLYAVDRVCSPVHTCSTCRARAAGRCVACEHNQSKMELQRHCAEWVQRSATHVYTVKPMDNKTYLQARFAMFGAAGKLTSMYSDVASA